MCVRVGFNFCSGVACPTGGKCTSQSSDFTYSCNCTDGYSVSGTVSSSKPLVQSCTPSYSPVTVVLAVVIPVVCGIVIILVGIFAFFAVRQYASPTLFVLQSIVHMINLCVLQIL